MKKYILTEIITKEEYNELCKEYHLDIEEEEYNSEEIYDLSKCIIKSQNEDNKKIVNYLKSLGVKDMICRLASDISKG